MHCPDTVGGEVAAILPVTLGPSPATALHLRLKRLPKWHGPVPLVSCHAGHVLTFHVAWGPRRGMALWPHAWQLEARVHLRAAPLNC